MLIDHQWIFEDPLLGIVQKITQKIHILAITSKYMPQKNLRSTMKTLVTILISSPNLDIHSREINHNKLHERALGIVCKDHFSSFKGLLSKNKSVTVHERNLQILNTEMYKILHSLSPKIMKGIFKTKTNYCNILNALIFSKRNVKAVRYRYQTMPYMGPKIWELVPKEMKQVTTLNEFKAKIKVCKLEDCPYQLSRTYLSQICSIT